MFGDNMDIVYVPYEEKYLEEMDYIEDAYWSLEEDESINDEIDDNSIIEVALDDNHVVGFLHAQVIGDQLEIHNILVKDEYQKKGIATHLMEDILKKTDDLGIKTSIANAVAIRGEHINSEKLLKKFGYKEIYRVEGYWDAIYPGYYCRQCDSKKCCCSNVVFLKNM